MSKWVAFYDSNGKELAAYTEAAFGWSRQETLHLCMGGDPVRVN
jgi:hypothetical protein